MTRFAWLPLTLLIACAGNSGPELLAGFTPPAPAAGQIQIISPIVRDIKAGQDITLCSYLPLDQALDQTWDITASSGIQSMIASHHSVLYMVQSERPVDTHECNDDDMVNSAYLAGAGGGDAGGVVDQIPDGIAFRVEAKRQLMIQTHWINATDKPVDGQAAYLLTVTQPSDSHQLAQLFTWSNTSVDLPAGQAAHAGTSCTVQRDMSFFRLGGHAHEHGTHVAMTWAQGQTAATTFYDYPWQRSYTFAPPTLNYTREQAMVVHAGDTLTVACDYNNDTSSDIVFPLEMCTGFGFYFPGTAQFDCTDGQWPAGLH
jgi:hypothetical protein